jgi:hypothetical protein
LKRINETDRQQKQQQQQQQQQRKMTKSSKAAVPTCAIDRDIVNEFTLAKMKDIGQSFFASACGKNRGAFVLAKPDGKTYSW